MKNIKKTAIISLISIMILGAIGPFSLAYGRRTYQIAVTANLAYGIISYDGHQVEGDSLGTYYVDVFPNKDVTFTITPNLGYHIEQIEVDGNNILSEPIYGVTTYTFVKVKENHPFEVIFAENAAVSVEGATINVLEISPLVGFDLIPGYEGVVAPFFDIKVSSLEDEFIIVTITYDDTGLSEAEEMALRLYIGNPVDVNGDGTINGNDVAAFQAIEQGEVTEENGIFDVNGDGFVNDVDLAIVKEYANSGLVVNPGNYDDGEFRVPWIDITYGAVDIDNNKIMGLTWHLSIFGCR